MKDCQREAALRWAKAWKSAAKDNRWRRQGAESVLGRRIAELMAERDALREESQDTKRKLDKIINELRMECIRFHIERNLAREQCDALRAELQELQLFRDCIGRASRMYAELDADNNLMFPDGAKALSMALVERDALRKELEAALAELASIKSKPVWVNPACSPDPDVERYYKELED